jgi:hypothetical protein
MESIRQLINTKYSTMCMRVQRVLKPHLVKWRPWTLAALFLGICHVSRLYIVISYAHP